MLHRYFHIISDTGYAKWQAGRRALYTTDGRQPVHAFWKIGQAFRMRKVFTIPGNVRQLCRGSLCLPWPTGEGYILRILAAPGIFTRAIHDNPKKAKLVNAA